MKFTAGSLLIYGSRGVCKIEEIRKERFVESEREYYVLRPMDDPKSEIYIPVDSDRMEKQARKILSPEEMTELIRSMPQNRMPWISDSRARNVRLHEILESGDRRAIAGAVAALWLHKQELSEQGKKPNTSDEAMFSRMERLLHEEFALVLGIPTDQVQTWLSQKIEGLSDAFEGSVPEVGLSQDENESVAPTEGMSEG